MFEPMVKTRPDWHNVHNRNFAFAEDKMTFVAECAYNEADGVYALQFVNIPAKLEADLLGGLPDLFPVVMRLPNDYVEETPFRIGSTDFAPKYAGFEAGDVLCVYFDKVEEKCFFRLGGGNPGGKSRAAYCGRAYAGYSYLG
jgi:hypothetical protein